MCQFNEIWKTAGLDPQRCIACDVCCRFPSPISPSIPFFSRAEQTDFSVHFPGTLPGGGQVSLQACPDGYRCPFFDLSAQSCSIYERRPLDCHLYPFVLMYDKLGSSVFLAIDEVCPFFFEIQGTSILEQAVESAVQSLEGPLFARIIEAPGMVSAYQEQSRPLCVLPKISRTICRSDLGLSRLVPTAYESLRPYFSSPSCLSGHAFCAMYLWRDSFHLYWKIFAESLLVFAESGGVSFLLAPPLGNGDMPLALAHALEVMSALGPCSSGWRVQEVGDSHLPAFLEAGWKIGFTGLEYVYRTPEISALRGNRYASKRHDRNRFLKSRKPIFRPYGPDDFSSALALFLSWQKGRCAKQEDPFYRAQVEDSLSLHLRTLKEALSLGMDGCVVEVEKELVAYTFGFPLSDGQTFAVFLEITDLSFPGLSAYVYSHFCHRNLAYPFINAGPDSLLPTLARSKKSYRPVRLVPTYVMNPPEKFIQ